MEPIKEEWCNTTFAKDQPEYLPLPAYKADDAAGTVTTCWKLSFRERLKALFVGKMYLSVYTFNQPLQPLKPWF